MATRRTTSMLARSAANFATAQTRPSASGSSLLLSHSHLLSSRTQNHSGYFSMLVSQFRRYSTGYEGGKLHDETQLKNELKDQSSAKRGKQESLLNKYGKDMTASLFERSEFDPVIGRDNEISRCIHILSKRAKNIPVIVGDHGVGKTAVVHGVARRILLGAGRLPRKLLNSELISLDMRSLIGGAKYDGNFEKRFEAVLKEAKESKREIILFIEDIHKFVGAECGVGNLLKPVLERGELQCIGTTTLNEYKKMEKDVDLDRRFQLVFCPQPSVQDTISILREVKEKYEEHHGVKISDSALVSAATLSDKYITDRFLPAKAIDLVDEAAAKLKIEIMEKSYTRPQTLAAALKQQIDSRLPLEKSPTREEVNDIDIEEIINEWIRQMPQTNLKLSGWSNVVELAVKTFTPESMKRYLKEIGKIVITLMERLKEPLWQMIKVVLHYAKKAALYFAENPIDAIAETMVCTIMLILGYAIIKCFLALIALSSEIPSGGSAMHNQEYQTTKIQERHSSKGDEVSTNE